MMESSVYDPMVIVPRATYSVGVINCMLGAAYKENVAHASETVFNPIRQPLDFQTYAVLIHRGGGSGVVQVRPQMVDTLDLQGDGAGSEWATALEGSAFDFSSSGYGTLCLDDDAWMTNSIGTFRGTGLIFGGCVNLQISVQTAAVEFALALYPGHS